MSVTEKSTAVARRVFVRLVASVREFALIAVYAAIVVSQRRPARRCTGSASDSGDGPVRTAYFGVRVVLMFVFAMLYRFVQHAGRSSGRPANRTIGSAARKIATVRRGQ